MSEHKYPKYLINKTGLFADFPAFKNRIGIADNWRELLKLIKEKGGLFTQYEVLENTEKGYICKGIYEFALIDNRIKFINIGRAHSHVQV